MCIRDSPDTGIEAVSVGVELSQPTLVGRLGRPFVSGYPAPSSSVVGDDREWRSLCVRLFNQAANRRFRFSSFGIRGPCSPLAYHAGPAEILHTPYAAAGADPSWQSQSPYN